MSKVPIIPDHPSHNLDSILPIIDETLLHAALHVKETNQVLYGKFGNIHWFNTVNQMKKPVSKEHVTFVYSYKDAKKRLGELRIGELDPILSDLYRRLFVEGHFPNAAKKQQTSEEMVQETVAMEFVATELQEPVGDDNGENNTVGTEDANADMDPRVPHMDRREDAPPRVDDQQPEEESSDQQPEEESSASCHCALV
ncbi:hypothetical protein L2E82_25773 [Cichorium intybus]|uniref:Uncharacterized protein n=1 Tax=Cichorium intybus TaxID=13427 RepID=A0ACB9E4L4_CICIN|nr:hypothetical protein L2E82_25773 [Cichorium intybus]